VLNHDLCLLWGSKLDALHGNAWHSISKVDVLESFIASNIVIVWNVNAEWASITSEANNLECGKVRSKEVVLLHFLWPWQLWNNVF